MIDQTTPSATATDLSLDDLARHEHMSRRAYNVCAKNELTSLRAILEYFRRTGSFGKLRNSGRLTDDELQRICRKYDGGDVPIPEPIPAEPKAPPIVRVDWESLSSEHREVIDRYLQLRLESISSRARNLLNHIYPRIDRSAREFEEYFGDVGNLSGHRQVGAVTMAEITGLRGDLVAFAENARASAPEGSMFQQFAAAWCDRFGLERVEVNRYRQDFIARRFPLFRFLWSLLNNPSAFAERDLALLTHRYPYILGATRRKLEEIGQGWELTRERVRQLAVQVPGKVRELVVSLGPLYDFVAYEAMQGRSRDLVIIDEEFAAYVNAREGVSFTSMFYAVVFEAFLNDTHDHVEEDFDASTDYLVRKELTEVFDFDAFVRETNERLNGRIPERTVVDLGAYVAERLPEEHHALLPRITAVCELLAREEFGIAADDAGNLIFERNTKWRQFEYIVAELEKRGEPMHVVDLFAAIEAEHPGIFSDAEAVRGTLLRTDRFARYDTSSTYGLKEWEQQYSHLKSGSFADIAEQHLRELARPAVLNDVVDYVLQYRKTTRQNVITTLKLDASNRFKFFGDGVVALANHDYPSDAAMVRPVSPRLLDGITRLIADHGNAVALGRLVDYCVLRYRMSDEQARGVFDRAIREGQLAINGEEMVTVPEADGD